MISLVLAFICWFLVIQIDDPKETKTFANIPVTLVNTELLDKEDKVYEVLDNTDTVRVSVTAPNSVINQLSASDIVAEADVSKLTDINTIAITYSSLNDGVDSFRGDHDVVRLNIEQKSSKWIRVQYTTVGEVADGYMVSKSSLDQTMIEVTGPESAVEQISYASVQLDVTDATNNLSANVEAQLCKEDGEVVEFSNVAKNVNYIHVSVEILATKTVPIEMTVTGTPKEGFLATGVTECEPSTVTIAGTASALAGISKISIPEESTDITDAEADVVNTVNLRELLPDNIRLADSSFNGKATVTVYVEPQVEKTLTIPGENISLQNVPDGWTAELEEQADGYEVDIAGLAAQVDLITDSAVTAAADVAAWMTEEKLQELTAGTYSLPVTVQLPEGMEDTVEIETSITVKVIFSKIEE